MNSKRILLMLSACLVLAACASTKPLPLKVTELEPEKQSASAKCLFTSEKTDVRFFFAEVNTCVQPNYVSKLFLRHPTIVVPSLGSFSRTETGEQQYYIDALAFLSYNVMLEEGIIAWDDKQYVIEPIELSAFFPDIDDSARYRLAYLLPDELVQQLLAVDDNAPDQSIKLQLNRPLGRTRTLSFKLGHLKTLAKVHEEVRSEKVAL